VTLECRSARKSRRPAAPKHPLHRSSAGMSRIFSRAMAEAFRTNEGMEASRFQVLFQILQGLVPQHPFHGQREQSDGLRTLHVHHLEGVAGDVDAVPHGIGLIGGMGAL